MQLTIAIGSRLGLCPCALAGRRQGYRALFKADGIALCGVQLHRRDGDEVVGHDWLQLLLGCWLGCILCRQRNQPLLLLPKLADAHRNRARVHEGVQRGNQCARTLRCMQATSLFMLGV